MGQAVVTCDELNIWLYPVIGVEPLMITYERRSYLRECQDEIDASSC